MRKVGERSVNLKSDGSEIKIPIYQKGHDVSKVVDENGEPLVVWHGQASTNYVKEFDAKSTFFTENKAVAEEYGDKFRHPLDESDKAIPVFLNIKTPHIYDAEGREYKNVNGGNFLDFDDFLYTHQEYEKEGWYWDYQVGEENITIPENVLNEYHKLSTSKTVRTYVSEKIGKDNDGVIVRNVLDPASGKVTDATQLITDYVANTPNQIKHIDNRDGEYTGPNIYHNLKTKSPSSVYEIKTALENILRDYYSFRRNLGLGIPKKYELKHS